MDKKNNMKQAMYEMFGVGADQAAKETESESDDIKVSRAAASVPPKKSAVEKEAAVPPAIRSSAAVSYLAPGTVFEGTIRSTGDIEIAGDFKGDIKTEGTVVLHSNVQGNVTAKSLKLSGCSLVGDVIAKEALVISQGSSITGNVTAQEVQCAGQIVGDMKVSESTNLESSAQVSGKIVTGSIAVVKGAMICGGIEIKPNAG